MKISSIFKSINGEVCGGCQGSLTAFVRLFGCNLRCSWCDTKYSYTEDGKYEVMRVQSIIKAVNALGAKNVTITGGEPLAQKRALPGLISDLLWAGYSVSVETNGSIILPRSWELGPRGNHFSWVVDYKLPSSGSEDQMLEGVFYSGNLSENDFVKFVVADHRDFVRALGVAEHIARTNRSPKFAFSPVWGSLKKETLAKWMLEEPLLLKLGAIYNLQIHKVLNVA